VLRKASEGDVRDPYACITPGISDWRRIRLAFSTAPAVVAWAAHIGWIHLNQARLHFLGSAAAVAVFTLFAVIELVADQLPSAPSRTAPPGLIARIVLGAFVRSGHRGVGNAIHPDRRHFGCGRRRCRSVWRLPGSHSPGKSTESSGLRDRHIGRRGGDWRGILHRVAILARAIFAFNKDCDTVCL